MFLPLVALVLAAELNTFTCDENSAYSQPLKRGDRVRLLSTLYQGESVTYGPICVPVDTHTVIPVPVDPSQELTLGMRLHISPASDSSSEETVVQSENITLSDSTKMLTFRTLVITLEKGVPMEMTWDQEEKIDAFCPSGATIGDFCAAECTEDCQTSIYIVFKGTDANGRRMQSESSAFSRFRQFSMQKWADQLIDLIHKKEDPPEE